MLAQLFVSAPFYIRTVKAGFESVEPVYEGVASTLGASPLRTFFRVTLPLAWPSLVAGAILCWARALSELGATLIFAGSLQGRTQTMPLAIISSFESGKSIDVPIALSLILVAAAAVLLRAAARAGARRAAIDDGYLTMFSIDIEARVGDFQLRPRFDAGNELVVLFGPSGCGKSLTLQAVAGLLRPDAAASPCRRASRRSTPRRASTCRRSRGTSVMSCRSWRSSRT